MRVSELVAEEDTPARLTGAEIKRHTKSKGGETVAAFVAHEARETADCYRGG